MVAARFFLRVQREVNLCIYLINKIRSSNRPDGTGFFFFVVMGFWPVYDYEGAVMTNEGNYNGITEK